MSSLTEKAQLRAAWKRDYPRDPNEHERSSRQICAAIAAAERFRQARFVALFSPLPWEPNLLDLWRARPEACVFPVSDPAQFRLEFFSVSRLEDLTPGFAGILEPPKNPKRAVVQWDSSDLVLVPGFAFDARGGRVGSGAGFYDRFLQTLPVTKWGVAFARQIVKQTLAQDPTDVRMDAVVSELGVYEARED